MKMRDPQPCGGRMLVAPLYTIKGILSERVYTL